MHDEVKGAKAQGDFGLRRMKVHKASKEHGLRHRIHQATFNAIYQRSLLYNQCWEDPRLDREAMQLNSDSEIVMITSAGCNALDYLLQEPKRIHCIDANPRQTALLELKIAAIKSLEWEEFFQLFGRGRHKKIKKLYREKLRPLLTEPSAAIWDKNLNWWRKGPVRRGFYDHGLSGIFARAAIAYMQIRPGLLDAVKQVLDAPDVEAQRHLWDTEVKTRLFAKPVVWTMERQATMNLLGVPYEQQRQAAEDHEDGIAGYIQESIGRIARDLPTRDNYFYRVYVHGEYTPEVCPEYLREENFERLKTLVDRIVPVTDMLTRYLNSGAAKPTHLVLLDHMDWMGTAFPESLTEEWEAILTHSETGARVLFRSGEVTPRFLDDVEVRGKPIREAADWNPELSASLHPRDRVGTYASFWIGDLRNEPATA